MVKFVDVFRRAGGEISIARVSRERTAWDERLEAASILDPGSIPSEIEDNRVAFGERFEPEGVRCDPMD